MKRLILVCLGLICILPLRAAPVTDEEKVAASDCGFSFRLLKELVKEEPARNVLVSPYSASTVLQMVCNGAGGRTKTEMSETLGTSGLQQNAINAATLRMQDSLNAAGTNVMLNIANAIWCRKNIVLKPAFVAENQQFFHAAVESLDFNDPWAAARINGWVAEKTHGRISDMVQAPLDPAIETILANAVYFKGKWTEPFEAKDTTNRVFHLRGGGQKQAPTMEQSRHFEYRRGSGYQAVRLAYEGGSLGMYIFLPDEGSSPDKLLSIMNGDTWQRVTRPGFSDHEGMLRLPKFRIEYGVELNRPLKALGMKQAFSPQAANLSGISDDGLFISQVLQKAFVEVNEEGTEAAVVTMVMNEALGPEPPPPLPFRMIVDRPFLFLIEDQNTGVILFMGVVFDPS